MSIKFRRWKSFTCTTVPSGATALDIKSENEKQEDGERLKKKDAVFKLAQERTKPYKKRSKIACKINFQTLKMHQKRQRVLQTL